MLLAEDAVLGGVDGEEVDVVEMAHADAAAGVALRLVLQRGPELRRRLVALGLVEELEAMAVGIEELYAGPWPRSPSSQRARDAGRLERRDAPLERLRAVRAVREVPDARPARAAVSFSDERS